MRMKIDKFASGKRKAVNLSLDTGVVETARKAGLNLSQVCEAALREAGRAEAARQWREDNKAWSASVNDWLERNGLPLERYRQF